MGSYYFADVWELTKQEEPVEEVEEEEEEDGTSAINFTLGFASAAIASAFVM